MLTLIEPRENRRVLFLLGILGIMALVFTTVWATPAQGQEAADVVVSQDATLGNILTDPEGNTLYLFTRDERNVSNCSGGCATAWPPLLTTADPVAGEGVNAGRLGTITRSDNSLQVTYNGWPLYYRGTDVNPGDTNGQDIGGVWFVVSTYGGPIQSNAIVMTSESLLGTILTEASGRTLYLLLRDEASTSSCSGGCARAWLPLLTVAEPAPGNWVKADLLGTITRDDGYIQVTYNGWPLHYYSNDESPGDTNGQNIGGVWFVVSPTGAAIMMSPSADDILLVALNEQNSSGQSGWAKLTDRGDDTEVMLLLSEGAMVSKLVHIHSGQCGGDTLGGVANSLTNFSDEMSVTLVEGVSLDSLLTGDFAINAHNIDDGSVYTACGNLPSKGDTLTIALDEQNDSGQSGWATLIDRGNDTEVVLSLSTGAMETRSVHIHSGQCGASLGGVVHGLTSFVGGAGGSTTLLEGVSLDSLLTGDFAINAHNAETGSIYTACGNIPDEDIVLIALNEQNASGQSGWAKLTSRGNDTKVVLSLSTGDMETRSVHIHSGQCGANLGGVVHGLTSFVGGAGGSTTLLEGVSLDSLLTGDFAINAHNAETGSIYTACGNLPSNVDTLTIALNEQNDSGQSGWATLTDRGSDTEVVLSLSTGDMETRSVHIHSGQCGANLGGVVHGLTSFVGGAGGSTTLLEGVSLDSLLTGDFAINAQNAETGSIYTACGNIPAQTNIASGSTSTFTSVNGVVSVSVPATAPVGPGSLSYAPKTSGDAPAAAPAGFVFGSTLFELSVLDVNNDPIQGYTFDTSITISLKYTDDDLQAVGGNPGRLVLQKYDTVLQTWTPLNTSWSPVAATVQAQVSRLSFFALMGQAQFPTPTPTATATLSPGVATSTSTTEAPSATLLPPTPGDVTPGSGLLIGLLIVAFIFIAAGGYYLQHSRQS